MSIRPARQGGAEREEEAGGAKFQWSGPHGAGLILPKVLPKGSPEPCLWPVLLPVPWEGSWAFP